MASLDNFFLHEPLQHPESFQVIQVDLFLFCDLHESVRLEPQSFSAGQTSLFFSFLPELNDSFLLLLCFVDLDESSALYSSGSAVVGLSDIVH